MTRPLSDKWWNVNRRAASIPPSYVGDPPRCPDCAGDMYLTGGKYGRFYKCSEPSCMGTVGAKENGTPRTPRGDVETCAARMRAAQAFRGLMLVCEVQNLVKAESIWVRYPFDDALELVGRHPDNGLGLCIKTKGKWRFVKGLFLRKRSRAEAEKIEHVCNEIRSEVLYGEYFKRLLQNDLEQDGEPNHEQTQRGCGQPPQDCGGPSPP